MRDCKSPKAGLILAFILGFFLSFSQPGIADDTLARAIASIGSNETTLLIPNEQDVTADLTVPVNITLRFNQGGCLDIATGVTVTINGHVEAGLYQIFSWTGTGKVVFGAGALEKVYPQWWGAKGDKTSDDTVAIQAAVDACLYDVEHPQTLAVTGQCKLTASIIINRPFDSSISHGAFRIIGMGPQGGFYVSSAINMFSSSLPNGTYPVSEAISFENIQFEASNPALAAYVLDGDKFLRIQFLNCRFCYVKCLTATIYIQSIYFAKCMMREWAGTFLSSAAAFDISLEGNLMEWGGALWACTGNVHGGRFINNLLEGCTGRPIDFAGSVGLAIHGNYIEHNECTSPYVKLGVPSGVSVSGNAFLLTATQEADPAFFAVEWTGPITAGISAGNYCSGRLNKLTGGVTAGSFMAMGNYSLDSLAPQLSGLSVYANNAAALAGGLTAGMLYRTNGDPDTVCVVH